MQGFMMTGTASSNVPDGYHDEIRVKGAPLRVRITGDLTKPETLEVVQADTGAKITNIISMDIHASRVPSECWVHIKVWGCELDITGEVRPSVDDDGQLVTTDVELG